MGLENSKALHPSYSYPIGSVPATEIPKQKKRSRISTIDDDEQPMKRSNSAPAGILDQYQCRLLQSAAVDNMPIIVNGSAPNVHKDIVTRNYDYSIFWKETDIFSLQNSILKCRDLPAYVLPKLPPLANELSKHVIKAFPPDPGLYQASIISKVVQNLQYGKRGDELRESLYQGYYPCSNDVINVINHITTPIISVRHKYLSDLVSMYLKYPYIRSTIIQSIDCYLREQIEYQKESYDPMSFPVDYCSELIRILSTDMKLFNEQLISTILSLLYVDFKMLYYKSIIYYIKDACLSNPFYSEYIFNHILKRWRSFPSVIQMLAIELIENVYKLTPINIKVKYRPAIITRLMKCLQSQHSFIMSQAQVAINSIETRMISKENFNSFVSVSCS